MISLTSLVRRCVRRIAGEPLFGLIWAFDGENRAIKTERESVPFVGGGCVVGVRYSISVN